MLSITSLHGIVQSRKGKQWMERELSSGVSLCLTGRKPFPEVPRALPSHLISQNLQRWPHRGAAREAGEVSSGIFSFCRRKWAKKKGFGEATNKVFQKSPEGEVKGADRYWEKMKGRQNQREEFVRTPRCDKKYCKNQNDRGLWGYHFDSPDIYGDAKSFPTTSCNSHTSLLGGIPDK